MCFYNDYQVATDIKLVREMRGLSKSLLAKELKIDVSTVSRWETGSIDISRDRCEAFYNYAFRHGVLLNQIKEQFYKENLHTSSERLLFHGAKRKISGSIRYDAGRANNDFGKGFYCGESLMQSALFVSNFSESCIYMVDFDMADLRGETYHVDTEWMLTIALFRGRLDEYRNNAYLQQLYSKVEEADYIIAPIADNRMYEVIEDYISGEITDEQCRHALAATDLGLQFVMKSQAATDSVVVKERCYLCEAEKQYYQEMRDGNQRASADKVKAARIQYRGKGKYIDEVFGV